MKPTLRIYKSNHKLAKVLAIDFINQLQSLTKSKDQVDIALSGGSTPSLFFKAMVDIKPSLDWQKIRIFWVDERCVAPDHPESNYRVAYKEFLSPLDIPQSSYFRIKGENDPYKEANEYANLILDTVSPEMTFPVFDLIFLGMGTDGHTASIFPNQIDLWSEENICTVGTHPVTGQKRVTFTGHLINAAAKVVFMVSGEDKAEIAHQIITKSGKFSEYPASLVDPHNGELEWYMDSDAAAKL